MSQNGGLGYGQTDPYPARIQAGVEYRPMQRRLHETEQALAAERAVRTTHPQQQQQHAPAPPYDDRRTHQPRYGRDTDDHGDTDFEEGYRPFEHSTDDSQQFAAWEWKEELKAHKIEVFSGQTDLEGLLKWFRSVEHYGCLAGFSKVQIITKAWKFFSSEVLDWFRIMLRNEYGVTRFPPPRYPFSWRELKTRMEATYASAFSINYVWRDLSNLKRGRDVAAFHSRFTTLARLVGKTPDTALYSSRLWDFYDRSPNALARDAAGVRLRH